MFFKVRGAYANVLETDPQDTVHQVFHARSMYEPALEGQLFEIEKKSPGIIGPADDELQGRGFVHYGTKATSETARSGHQMICSKDGPRC